MAQTRISPVMTTGKKMPKDYMQYGRMSDKYSEGSGSLSAVALGNRIELKSLDSHSNQRQPVSNYLQINQASNLRKKQTLHIPGQEDASMAEDLSMISANRSRVGGTKKLQKQATVKAFIERQSTHIKEKQ